MMWGTEYDKITPYVHHHHYYTSGRYLGAPGGGVEWLKYEEAAGDTSSPAYQEFLGSIENLARLIDAGNRAVRQVNADTGSHIQTQLHFAFNVIEQPTGLPKVQLDPDKVFAKVMTLISTLNSSLTAKGGMVDRIGLSYYPDWHGSYAIVQKNLAEISKVLPGVKLNIAEMSPPSSGTLTDPLANPNHPLGFVYTTQSQGDDTMDVMKVINDIPNNVGTGVWPWAGTNVYGTGNGANGTLRASFKVFNDAFAKNVVESGVSAVTDQGRAPALPATVKSLDLATGVTSDVPVTWDPIDPSKYATAGTFTVNGTASVTVPSAGRGIAMRAVTATVDVGTWRASDVGGTVPATLSLSLGAPATFGAFTPAWRRSTRRHHGQRHLHRGRRAAERLGPGPPRQRRVLAPRAAAGARSRRHPGPARCPTRPRRSRSASTSAPPTRCGPAPTPRRSRSRSRRRRRRPRGAAGARRPL